MERGCSLPGALPSTRTCCTLPPCRVDSVIQQVSRQSCLRSPRMPGAGTQGQRGWSGHLRRGETQPLRRTPHWTHTVSTEAHTAPRTLAEGLSLGIASSTLTGQSGGRTDPTRSLGTGAVSSVFRSAGPGPVETGSRPAVPGTVLPTAVPVSLGHHCSLTCNPSTHGPAPHPAASFQPGMQTDFRPVLD